MHRDPLRVNALVELYVIDAGKGVLVLSEYAVEVIFPEAFSGLKM